MPFNSPYNDYMYALDDLNNLGWFASDRYQPEGKVCVYVFVPNSTKQVYDYETADPQAIIDAATLKEIKKTWSDPDKVRIARQHLAQVLYGGSTEKKKSDFRFVVEIMLFIILCQIFVLKKHGRCMLHSCRKRKILHHWKNH